MKKEITLLAAILFLTGCSVLKTAKLVKKGTVEQHDYSSTIRFDFDRVIRMPVKIKGKTYNFIFDTGAGISAISESLATDLGIKPKSQIGITDSQNNHSSLNLYLIDRLSIGDVAFLNQPFAAADFSKLDCGGEELDGIIGSHLMSKAVWFVDNENKNITIVDDRSKLKEMPGAEVIRFKTFNDGMLSNLNPYFNLAIPGFVSDKMVELDMGSTYGFSLNKNLVEKNAGTPGFFSTGNASLGLFGGNIVDTTYYFVTQTLKIDSMIVDEEMEISYKGTVTPTAGMDFLKNYNLILDWKRKEIILSKFHPHEKSTDLPYGFKIGRGKSGVVVNEILNNSDAEKKGLRLGDKILSIDDIDFKKTDEGGECARMKQFHNLKKPGIDLGVEQNGSIVHYTIMHN